MRITFRNRRKWKNLYERKIEMKLIEEKNGTIVKVVVVKAWLETFDLQGSDESSLIVKVRGETDDGRAGVANIWLDDEIITKGPGKGMPRIDFEIENLKHAGMKDGDFDNLWMIEGTAVDFYVAMKEKDGKTLYNYYMQVPRAKEITPKDAKSLIESIRGRAKKNVEAIQGTPIDGAPVADDKKQDDLPMNW